MMLFFLLTTGRSSMESRSSKRKCNRWTYRYYCLAQ